MVEWNRLNMQSHKSKLYQRKCKLSDFVLVFNIAQIKTITAFN